MQETESVTLSRFRDCELKPRIVKEMSDIAAHALSDYDRLWAE